jgi:[acyl-carrier-protein] S-malonyltransferase
MNGHVAFLFPGQGNLPSDIPQAASVEPLLARAEKEGLAIREWTRAGDAARLSRTDIAQPTVFLDSLARCALLEARGVVPSVVAGHSLGEYAALVAAGVFPAEKGLDLVLHRGRLMAPIPGGMTAIVKLDSATVAAVCAAVGRGAVVANHNGPRQFVVSGTLDALDDVEERVAELGGRAIRLDVSGPFHSPAMRPAQDALVPRIAATTFAPPRCTFVSSVSGRNESHPDSLRTLLARQITAPVRWTDVLATLAELGVTRAIEVGEGTVLTQLGKRAGHAVRFDTFEEVLHA